MDNRPIGVYDSGLGGLTAVKELEALLPGEDFVYFGDTGRVPYGTKGHDTIVKYASQVMRFLTSFSVKAVIIACGTVSSVAFNEISSSFETPMVGVVRPAVEAAVCATKNGKIGVLGTNATIRSGAYEKEILTLRPETEIKSRACPLFVPLVESGHIDKNDKIVQLAAHEYLNDFALAGFDTIILGCTHYPLLGDAIGEILGSGVTLINSGREVVRAAARLLREKDSLSEKTAGGKNSYYVSDFSEDFTRLAGILLAHPISGYVERTDIEKY